MSSEAIHVDGDEDSPVCPTCGDTFRSTRAVKIHHTKSHGESVVNQRRCEREGCDKQFDARPSSTQQYCSLECAAAKQSDRVALTCPGCEEEFSVPKCEAERRCYCSRACQKAHNHVTLTCEGCGDPFDVLKHRKDSARFCSASCRGRAGGFARDQGKLSTIECRVCNAEVGTYRPDERRYCSNKCRYSDVRRSGHQYRPRNPTGREGFERLVNHCYFKEGHDLDATTRIVRDRLEDGERWTREDVEELTGELLTKPRKVDQRLHAINPEDIGLTPIGGKR